MNSNQIIGVIIGLLIFNGLSILSNMFTWESIVLQIVGVFITYLVITLKYNKNKNIG